MLCHQQGFSHAVSSSVYAGNAMNQIINLGFTPHIASVIPIICIQKLSISTSYKKQHVELNLIPVLYAHQLFILTSNEINISTISIKSPYFDIQ